MAWKKTKVDKLIEKYGGFFAFSSLQFADQKKRGVKYFRDSDTGLHLPAENVKDFLLELTL
jgi:hypothetical protein